MATTQDVSIREQYYLPAMPTVDAESIEKALTLGDLSKMPAEVRVRFYVATCQSAGLNPLTRPFTPMKDQSGQVFLYANATCAEQLRKRDRVSVRVTDRHEWDDLYTVTVEASTPDGRVEESQGIVEIGSLKGQARGNAMMKAETKAKRRATLALCGLGFPPADEGGAHPVRMDFQTGALETPRPVRPTRTVAGAIAPDLNPLTGELRTDPLMERITALLIAQGLTDNQQATYWQRMCAKYPDIHEPCTLTLLYENLQAAAQKKRAQTQEAAQDAPGATITPQDDAQDGPGSEEPDLWQDDAQDGPGSEEPDLWQQEDKAERGEG